MPSIVIPLLIGLWSSLRGQAELPVEIVALHHQWGIWQRRTGVRPRLHAADRILWSRLWPGWRRALGIVQPETVLGWHRRGFRLYWRWKSLKRGPGRPKVSPELRALMRKMSLSNPGWGAPRIHGELLKLGLEICETSVAQYLVRRRKPPSQTWRTFLKNHLRQIVAVDFLVVPTLTFRILFVFVVLAHDRRRILHCNLTSHPTAKWTAQQIREAFPWETAPRFLLRDRDGIYAKAFWGLCDSDGNRSGPNRTTQSLAEGSGFTLHLFSGMRGYFLLLQVCPLVSALLGQIIGGQFEQALSLVVVTVGA